MPHWRSPNEPPEPLNLWPLAIGGIIIIAGMLELVTLLTTGHL